jgi:hypothetical protein
MKEDEMGWACGKYGREENYVQGFGENLKHETMWKSWVYIIK